MEKPIKTFLEIAVAIITIFSFVTGITHIFDFDKRNNDNKEIITEAPTDDGPETPNKDSGGEDTGGGKPDVPEPVIKYLVDMKPSDGGELFNKETKSVEDGQGNVYGTHFTTYLSESSTTHGLTFGLGKKYTRFQGTMFVNIDAPSDSAFRLEIILDENRIYTSDIVSKYEPCNVDVDITGGEVIELVFCFENGTGGMEDGWYKQATANMADARFIP